MEVNCWNEQISNQAEKSNELFDENKINAQISQREANRKKINDLDNAIR